jgi:hypothetical protein
MNDLVNDSPSTATGTAASVAPRRLAVYHAPSSAAVVAELSRVYPQQVFVPQEAWAASRQVVYEAESVILA